MTPAGWTTSLERLGRSQGRWADYLFAVVAVGMAVLVHQILQKWLGAHSPYLLLTLAVFASSVFLGAHSGAFAALLSTPLSLFVLQSDGIAPHEWGQFSLFWMTASAAIMITALAAHRNEQAKRLELTGQADKLQSDRLAQELNLLIDSASNYAIFMLDLEGRVAIWNRGAERIFGWTETEILGQHHGRLFAIEDVTAGVDRHLVQARENGKQDHFAWGLRRDGSEFMASVTLAEIRDENGEPIGFGEVVRDVTDEKAHERAIEVRETHLRSILATVPDAMVVIDEYGLIDLFSPAAERLFGYTEAEAVGQNVSLLMASPYREAHDGYLARYRTTGERRIIGIGRRVIGRRKDGTTFPLELSIGEAVGGDRRMFTGFIRDLTARDAADARLRELQDELLHVSRVSAMGTMAATLAHELNQPLTAVANYVQTSHALLETVNHNVMTVREALAQAGAEALRAGSIVRRLREFVARGEVSKSIVPVSQLIENALLLGLADASERGIVCTLDVDAALGPVLIEPVQIQQVLINLIRNAVEAMQPDKGGEIVISVRGEGEFARFTIADTGPGLAPDMADQLFKAFVSTKRDGMGLGLSICRTIIEAHGGKIWAEAGATRGTRIHFTVPLAVTEDEDA